MDSPNEDQIIKEFNNAFHEICTVRHNFDMIYGFGENPSISIIGNLPPKSTLITDNDKNHQVKNLFYSFYLDCVEDKMLIKTVNLKKFALSSNINFEKSKKDFISFRTFKNQLKLHNHMISIGKAYETLQNLLANANKLIDEKKSLIDQLIKEKKKKSQLNLMMKRCSSQKILHDKMEQKSHNKEKLDEIYPRLEELSKQINQISENICGFKIKDDFLFTLHEIKLPKEILIMNGFKFDDCSFQVFVPSNKKEDCLQLLHNKAKGVLFEIIPIYTITIFHMENCMLDSNSFECKINQICEEFGAVVYDKKPYQFVEKQFFMGSIEIRLFTVDFIFPFANKVKNLMKEIEENSK